MEKGSGLLVSVYVGPCGLRGRSTPENVENFHCEIRH